MSRREEIKTLLTLYYRHLQKLKEQKAIFGAYTAPHILIEIENIEDEIKGLENELKNLKLAQASIKTNFVKEAKERLFKGKATNKETNDEKRGKVIEKLEDFISRLKEIQSDTPMVSSLMNDSTNKITERFDRLSRIIYEFLSKTISKAEAGQFSRKADLPFGNNRPFGSNSYPGFNANPFYSPISFFDFNTRHLYPALSYLLALKEAIEKGDVNIK
ncbi:MAG: hypothetical protein HND46_24260 [Chloroflexi bacterium]|nr:hypothetical protein [Chloroflexota bacterium]NOG66531.1 hypothetical protein [Chloroflexota bacterium]GIK40598.1 MAG: hypothetical protein BroJett011_44310 [Chloroflexota bacterium]